MRLCENEHRCWRLLSAAFLWRSAHCGASTQWAAAMLVYQPVLGRALIKLAGIKIMHPGSSSCGC
jgi:hypothetical protein